tara:strand:+ start:172 stop:345 length:174 start_codon:yes stop_codon:yes gene_type:complete
LDTTRQIFCAQSAMIHIGKRGAIEVYRAESGVMADRERQQEHQRHVAHMLRGKAIIR